MGKKYYVIEDSLYDYNVDWYFSEDEAEADHWIKVPDREYGDSYGGDYYNDVKQALLDIDNDLETSDDESLSDEEVLENIVDTCNYYINKDSGKKLSLKEVLTIYQCAEELSRNRKVDEPDTLAEAFTIIYDIPFVAGTMRGSSQGDYLEYICPTSMTEERLEYIEAVMFGTGIVLSVSGKAYEVEDLPEDISDWGWDYIPYMSDTKLKEYVSNQLYSHPAPTDIEVLTKEEYKELISKSF